MENVHSVLIKTFMASLSLFCTIFVLRFQDDLTPSRAVYAHDVFLYLRSTSSSWAHQYLSITNKNKITNDLLSLFYARVPFCLLWNEIDAQLTLTLPLNYYFDCLISALNVDKIIFNLVHIVINRRRA